MQPHTFSLPVLADDILILASDGLSDNLWDEDVLDEVLKFRRQDGWGLSRAEKEEQDVVQALAGLDISGSSSSLLKRKAFAGMLSEALCSRAKRVSETRTVPVSNSNLDPRKPVAKKPRFSIIPEEAEPTREGIELVTSSSSSSTFTSKGAPEHEEYPDPDPDSVDAGEIPFARRAKLNGKRFRGGKVDGGSCFYLPNEKIFMAFTDISVIVAIISPCPAPAPTPAHDSSQTTPSTKAKTNTKTSTSMRQDAHL